MLALLSALVIVASGCSASAGQQPAADWKGSRDQMIERQILGRGVTNERVIEAMRQVPRHLFVPETYRASAYEDRPLPIGFDQTISQPYIVAYMTELLAPKPGDRVLEIGSGSGYQAAVLARLVREVYTVEIVDPLAERARTTLAGLGHTNVHVRSGDGYAGWPDAAPFDKIIVTAAPPSVPQALIDQLAVGGTLVVPVGPTNDVQTMTIIRKTKGGVTTERTIPVRFVPMVPE